jgi:hypothetical protein
MPRDSANEKQPKRKKSSANDGGRWKDDYCRRDDHYAHYTSSKPKTALKRAQSGRQRIHSHNPTSLCDGSAKSGTKDV